ncbi:FAD-dependent oxidoreductase [Actinomadura madurae]|nr:FAD-dependent oxidoreductase [Actinomadura madurae]MCP9979507.1 FAD-dependent oxidoreductase [Actinomadura madurae]
MASQRTRQIVIVGGGYVGMYTALRLQKKLRGELRRGEVGVTVIDPQSYMTYQPFLPEAAAGNLEPRHVVAPLRKVLKRCRVVNGFVTRIDHASRRLTIRPAGASTAGVPERDIDYDMLVVALGSISRTLPIPGLADCGIGFKTVEEAIFLRNHVLHQLDIAASNPGDEDVRRRALTFVFVGAGFAGIEAMAELEDMARDACKWYPTIDAGEMRWMMVEATDRILPEVGPEMGRHTADALRRRGIEVKLETLLKSAEKRRIVLSDGEEFDAGTLVWTAGVKPHPVVRESDLPLDDKGRVKTTAELTVDGLEHVYAAGRQRGRPRPHRKGGVHRAQRAARGQAGQAPRRQHRGRRARQAQEALPARLRRVRGEPRPPQGRRERLRGEAPRAARLGHAPHLPSVADADRQPQVPDHHGLDARAVLPA